MSDSLILKKCNAYPAGPEVLHYISPETKKIYLVNRYNCYVPGIEYEARKDHSTYANLLLRETSQGRILGSDHHNVTLTLFVQILDEGIRARPFTFGINETFEQLCVDLKADKLYLTYKEPTFAPAEVGPNTETLEIDENNIASALRIAKEDRSCTLVVYATKMNTNVLVSDAHRSAKVPGTVSQESTSQKMVSGLTPKDHGFLQKEHRLESLDLAAPSDSDSEYQACDTPTTTSTNGTVIGKSHSMEKNALFASSTNIASRKDHSILAKQLLEMVANKSLSIDDYNKLTMPTAVYFALQSNAEVFVIGINETSDSLHTALAARKLYFSHHDPSMAASVYQEVTEDNIRGLLRFAKQYEKCSLKIIKGLGA